MRWLWIPCTQTGTGHQFRMHSSSCLNDFVHWVTYLFVSSTRDAGSFTPTCCPALEVQVRSTNSSLRSFEVIKSQVYLFSTLAVLRKPHIGQMQCIYVINCCYINVIVFKFLSSHIVNTLSIRPHNISAAPLSRPPSSLEAILAELGALFLHCFCSFLSLRLPV